MKKWACHLADLLFDHYGMTTEKSSEGEVAFAECVEMTHTDINDGRRMAMQPPPPSTPPFSSPCMRL